jgi:hypothetical protein
MASKSPQTHSNWILAVALLGIVLLNFSPAPAQESPTLGGQWTATVGESRTFRGKWIGQALPGQPEAAHGSWTLTSETGQTSLRGPWEAGKSARGWQGTWRATDQAGRLFSGTWKGDIEKALPGTLETMLGLTSQKELSGSWRSGDLRGFWWLKGAAQPVGRPATERKPPDRNVTPPR